jgi:tellurite methyltransferase
MDETFWNKYYSTDITGDNAITTSPSSFAQFCSKYMRKNDSVVDLGCGNGRDTIYFSACGHETHGVDISPSVTDRFEGTNVQFTCKSIDDLEDNINLSKCTVAYSRFSLHSVSKKSQDTIFKWVADSDFEHFYIETRSVNDPRYGVGTQCVDDPDAFIDTHYRRFTRLSDLTTDLKNKYGFKIVHAEEDFTSANYKTDMAVVNRIICSI